MTETALADAPAPTVATELPIPPAANLLPAANFPVEEQSVEGLQGRKVPLPRVDIPAPARPLRVRWSYAINLAVIHALALLACVPWFFSWTGLLLFVAGFWCYGTLGITLCYHRLLTHQGFTLPKWLEHGLAILGLCTLQDTPARWVAVHRMHHKHADRQDDPHTPLVNFFWAHVGWVVVLHREHSPVRFYEQYAKDILRDPFYLRLERGGLWFWTYLAHVAAYYFVGLAIGWALTGRLMEGVQFGASLMVWGAVLRTVATWHNTWIVNSAGHIWGYRNYDTPDDSTNHWFMGLMAHGDGWHNNHHADQRAAAHGHRWFEFDQTYWVILTLERLGLAKNVVRPRAWKQNPLPATAN